MTHSEMQGLLPLYALHALPDEEDMELRIHVDTCNECAQILSDHMETASALAATVQPVVPSSGLKARILDEVRAPEVVELASRRRVPMLRRLVPAAAVAAFVAVAGLSAVLVRRVDTQNAQLQEQRRLLALASSPAVDAVGLQSTTGAGDASGRLFVDPDRRVSGMVLSGLRDPGDNVYALWLIEQDKPKLVENFSPDASGGAIIFLPTDVGQARAVAVTLEPRPDTPAPQGPMLLRS